MSVVALNKIREYIKNNKVASISELQSITNSSESSVRRYVSKLQDEKYLVIKSGGVEYIENNFNVVLDENIYSQLLINKDLKEFIAKKAANLVSENTTIYIDSGSTTYYMFDYLPKNIHIYTNSISNVVRALEKGFENVTILGGKLKTNTLAIVETIDKELLKKFNFNQCFLGTNAIDENGTITTPDKSEGILKGLVANNSKNIYVLVDSTKYNKKSFYDFTPENKMNIISDKKLKINNTKVNQVI